MAMYDIKGKTVAITGNNTVGYGAENKPIRGVVVQIEIAGDLDVYDLGHEDIFQTATFKLDDATKTVLGIDGDYVVSVKRGVIKENVAISSTAAKQPTFGDWALCDGTGGVVKVPADFTGYPTATVDLVDTANKTAIINIL